LKYTYRRQCEHPGCKEVRRYGADTQRELREALKSRRKELCPRHTDPESVLSATNRQTEVVIVNQEHATFPCTMFWDGKTGFVYGPGFRAFADDFPAGARIVVTARLELPGDDSPQER
jgi:hypothetical protein